ncbi:hypothetical protein Zmor_027697 [Zophobas morio]|uniref:Uncharacterized protein n=1 Tax=Zophobas morio TaxID=2755281 RepID=A0AA38M3J5_9CUCU|nr:hypothetical protein Zmor_027697 [Zophobas morio]
MAALHLRERLGIFIIRGWSTLPRIFTKLMLPALESTPNRPNESSMQPKPVIKGCQSYAQAVAQIDKELQNAHGFKIAIIFKKWPLPSRPCALSAPTQPPVPQNVLKPPPRAPSKSTILNVGAPKPPNQD